MMFFCLIFEQCKSWFRSKSKWSFEAQNEFKQEETEGTEKEAKSEI